MATPVNQILTWLAVSDILTMVSYIPFALHFYCQFPNRGDQLQERNSHAWMSFLLFHINITSTTHTISIWMCVTLAIIRYIHITNPTKTNGLRIKKDPTNQDRNYNSLHFICNCSDSKLPQQRTSRDPKR
ncbi:hypothetical protein DPMN_130380 [Dreissena polymorpha]|uniref:G-protein coupled receptors family 1 profile domain-containing protein n=1 Tax=Dreissena polymorpha TaxID=45954 RepID=A0A9D4H6H4_DREPO|nr:hypothetical protein DPMN_130380 [Dreissena polymorpha]